MENNTIALAKKGKNKAAMLHILTSHWVITDTDREAADVTNYFLLYWNTDYFKESIKDGCIVDVDGNIYCVIWHDCSPYDIKHHYTVAISFRRSSIGNFALVSPQSQHCKPNL